LAHKSVLLDEIPTEYLSFLLGENKSRPKIAAMRFSMADSMYHSRRSKGTSGPSQACCLRIACMPYGNHFH
jgi:hypothetical protein